MIKRAPGIAVSLAAVLLPHASASAQDAPPGPNGGPDVPGAYASPSAIPQDPQSRDIGVAPSVGMRRLEPIALPERPDEGLGSNIDLPSLRGFAPPPTPQLDIVRPPKSLRLKATLGKDGPEIPSDLVWRLFAPLPGPDGKLPVVAMAKGPQASFDVPAGGYLLHVGFGRAGMTKRIDFSGEDTQETVALDAGGLRLHAAILDGKVLSKDKLRFDVYSADAGGERRLLATDVDPGAVLRLNAGNYHVISRYGSVNAVARADIRVEAGKITDATLHHRAAEVTMKLVREKGGEALADTAWSVTSAQGDIIEESVGAFASMVLTEGDYVLVARNKDRIFQREVAVRPGENEEVEVLTSDLVDPNDPKVGTGD
ncbi:hypothetical protein [Aureimonas sp. SK2]|uniref:hypothetical protein n=1 Tax=Aureimonas sp. SK2 TaxID=3015992 RepID=UPI0024442ECD|nr:hypothetical protein [Aureimonas sp. SK2]